jgi:DNA-binding transcriptional regulator YbjK
MTTSVTTEIAATDTSNKPGRRKSSKGEETRAKINGATLQIIKRDGMRGVRHRAVAKEAGVPLSATTYHFKNIEDLIVSAFVQWRSGGAQRGNPITNRVLGFIEKNATTMLQSESGRITLAREIYQFMVDYELDQIERHRDDRVIELAFYHESLLLDELRRAVLDYWETQLEVLIMSLTALHSPDPVADARITQSIFHQLEREAVMKGDDNDRTLLKATLHRHVCHLMGVEFTP